MTAAVFKGNGYWKSETVDIPDVKEPTEVVLGEGKIGKYLREVISMDSM